jgi:hypothetical protein
MKHKIVDLIKNNTAKFSHYRKGLLYYYINIDNCTYNFPVPIVDTDDATFSAEDKASMFLRWIRKADETDQLVMTEKKSDIEDSATINS